MSGYVIHSSRSVLRWVLVLALGIMGLTGCSGEFGFYRAYNGPELPLEEVAVLLLKEDVDVWVKCIDDRDISLWKRELEYHMLPGTHDVTLFYESTVKKGKPITLSYEFEKGNVYHPEAKFLGRFNGRGEIITKWWFLGTHWTPEIVHDGTIEEVAPRRANERFAPPHWRELAKRQSPSSGGKDEQ